MCSVYGYASMHTLMPQKKKKWFNFYSSESVCASIGGRYSIEGERVNIVFSSYNTKLPQLFSLVWA